jgi:HEAT repeat protein
MLGNAGGDARGIKSSAALRVLKLVESISDCSRLSSYLIQLLRHPNPGVRSKAALLLGKSNLNLSRVKSFLSSDDPRLRANTVESLWGHRSPAVQEVLREAAKDPNARTSMNALVELCRQGDREAFERISNAATASDPVMRSRAAWAMGVAGDQEFAPLLEKLEADENPRVKLLSLKARAAKPSAKPPAEPAAEEPAPGQATEPKPPDAPAPAESPAPPEPAPTQA